MVGSLVQYIACLSSLSPAINRSDHVGSPTKPCRSTTALWNLVTKSAVLDLSGTPGLSHTLLRGDPNLKETVFAPMFKCQPSPVPRFRSSSTDDFLSVMNLSSDLQLENE